LSGRFLVFSTFLESQNFMAPRPFVHHPSQR
jgi:hypothetical protein